MWLRNRIGNIRAACLINLTNNKIVIRKDTVTKINQLVIMALVLAFVCLADSDLRCSIDQNQHDIQHKFFPYDQRKSK